MSKSSNGKNTIAALDLTKEGRSVEFILKTMEEVEAENAEIYHAPHRHNYYTIIWVVKGTGKHDIDFKTYEVAPGIIYFISPEQVHYLQMSTGHSGYVMMFSTDFAEQFGFHTNWLKDSGFFFRCDDVAPLQIPGESASVQLSSLIGLISREYKAKDRFYLEAIASLIKLFVLECMRIRESHGPVFHERSHAKAQLVRQFKDLLDNNYAKWHKVSEYAAELHITANYLNEVLSSETGMSAKDFILNRIMLEAKRFATYSNTSAKEVAYDLGFDDPAHFSKLFRQHQGKSFTDFRNNLRSPESVQTQNVNEG